MQPGLLGLTLLRSAERSVPGRDRGNMRLDGSEVSVSCATGIADSGFARTKPPLLLTDYVQSACRIGRVN